MTFTPADSLTLNLFMLFSAVMALVIGLAVWQTHSRFKEFLAIFAGYLALFSGVAASGMVLKMAIPVVPLMFASVIAGAAWFAFSDFGRRIAAHFSFAALIGFQGFRLPLELILHKWAELGTVPPTMTWTGQNWDIISGIVSIAAIPFVKKSRALAWAAQCIAFLLLLNVLRVVIMSSPFPFAWHLEQPLQLIAYMPYALIGPLFVGAAMAGHLIVFRKLRRNC